MIKIYLIFAKKETLIFTDIICEKIERLGSYGYDLHKIATELNMSSSQLRDACLVDEDLNHAIENAIFNYKMFKKSEIESNPNQATQKSIYENIINEIRDKSNDNRITIEIVK